MKPPRKISGTRRKNIEKRRRRVLDTAARIIMRDGIDALSMRRLAAESDLVVKTLYNLFGSKEHILSAIIEAGSEEIEEAIAGAAESVESFVQMLGTIERTVLANAAILKPAIVAGYYVSGMRDKRAMKMHARRTQIVAEALQTGVNGGLVENTVDVDVAAELLYRNYIHLVADWAFGTLKDRQFKLYARYNTLLSLSGIAATPYRKLIADALITLQEELVRGRKTPRQARRKKI